MPKFIGTDDLRFYLYLSASKVDMLYDQLYARSGTKRRKLTAGLPLISASIEFDSEEKLSVDQRLRLVEEDLEGRGLVGSVEEPKTYFKGTMRMRWGLFDDQGRRPDDEPALVYFGGFDNILPLVVGLGGSSKHVIGHEGASSTWSRSATPELVRWLVAGLRDDSAPEPKWWDRSQENELFAAMAIALHYFKPPTQDLEFLAKTLTTGTVTGYESFIDVPSAKAILGTPLYVAQVDPLPSENIWGLDEQW